MPLVCKGGLIYLELQGIPTEKDLQTYPSVHLTSPHEWDPSILDYEHPEENGYINRSLSILDILDETPQISQMHNQFINKHVFQ